MAPKKPEGDDIIPVLTLPPRGEDEPEDLEAEPNPEMEAMQAKLDAMEVAVSEGKDREERFARMQEQFMSRPAAAPLAPVAPAPPEVSFKDMPDPSLEPERFASEMAARTTALATQAAERAANARIAPAASAMDVQQKLADLKTRFTSAWPDLKDYGDLVDAEIGRRSRDAAARGMDVEAMVLGNPDGFVKDVGTAVTARLTELRGPATKEDSGDGSGRDVALVGGGPTPGGGGKKTKAEPADFMQQLAKAQRDSGFF